MISRLTKAFQAIFARNREHHIFAFAATGSYFLLLSFIPFILVLLVLIRYTTISETDMMNMLITVVPSELARFVSVIVKEVYTKSIAVVPISIILTLWSAAKGLHALSYGLNVIAGVKEERNWVYMRVRSMFYTLLFVLAIMALLFLTVFAKGLAQNTLLANSHVLGFLVSNRYILSCILLTLLFVFMYHFLPGKKMEVTAQLPGALMTGIAWTAFSWILSMFYNPSVMNMYGSMTAIILAMIWMYFCMYFFLIGAEINAMLASGPEDNLVLGALRDAAYALRVLKERRKVAAEMAVYVPQAVPENPLRKEIRQIFREAVRRKRRKRTSE